MFKKFQVSENRILLLVFLLILVVTLFGMPLDLIDPDAALYASISKTIYTNNDFINLYSLGHDWLDKPHLPFWITALSFKLFGVSNFAYKLPAVLIFFSGIFFTYKFTKENYNIKTAIYAALILATATHSIISNFDVRAEPYLTAFMISTIYFVDKYLKTKHIKHLIFACLFAAFAIMTKGIFAIIPLMIGLGGELIVKRKWKEIVNPIWLLAIVLIFIFILPELYTLYIQFDTQPDKIIFGAKNTSGLKFFFWDSQFGRFFNTAPIKGSGDVFFFLHTILWAFLPWGILYYIATFFKIKKNLKKVNAKEEFYTIFISLSALFIFSLSKFQLAHYTNIIFPFMAVMVADLIYKIETGKIHLFKGFKFITWFQNAVAILLIAAIWYLLKPQFNAFFLITLIVSVIAFYRIVKSKINKTSFIFLFTILLFLNVYSFLFTHFYPTILEYQGGVSAARFVNENYKKKGSLIDNKHHHFAFEYYLDNGFKRVDTLKINQEKGRIFYVNQTEYDLFIRNNVNFRIVKKIDNFQVSKLNLKFVNKETRKEALETRYLVEIL